MFIRGVNPIWSYVDLTGKQFDDTYYMFVLENVLPYLPATVYHDSQGQNPWNNPIQFLANGTLPDDIYFDPGSDASPNVYRLEFRKGNTQNDPLIYEVNNYIPGQEGGGTPSDIGFTTDNQITNPQFALVNFNSPLTISSSSSLNLEIAPGWFLELNITSGTGTATLNQVPLNNSSSSLTPSNAPYALRLTLSSWSSVKLKQRFQQNGVLWANKIVSCAMTAKVQGAPQLVNAQMVDSQGNPLGVVLNNKQINGDFNEVTGQALLPASINSDVPPTAYIEFQLLLPTTIDIFVTSFQIVAGNLPLEYNYEQDSVERQIDYTFHYFYPQLAAKPIPSFLTGWDFSENPAQFGDAGSLGIIGNNKAAYMWDQTIGFQSITSSIQYARSALENLQVQVVGTSQFALIQYLDQFKARQILTNDLSVMVRMSCATPITLTISLWYTTGAIPNVSAGNNNSLITALDANGFPTCPGWVEIARANGQKATFSAPAGLDSATKGLVGFNGWAQIASSVASNATAFAIVIGSGVCTNIFAEFDSISLVPGNIPTVPAPQTRDQVFDECQYYYEMSYESAGVIGTSVTASALYLPQNSNLTSLPSAQVYATSFTINYKAAKRAVPLIKLYSVNGAVDNVRAYLSYSNAGFQQVSADAPLATYWSANPGVKNANYVPISLVPMTSAVASVGSVYSTGAIFFHYTADARLGIV